MNTPVVLDKARQVGAVSVGNQQRFSRLTAAYGDREEQIVIINFPVAIAIKVRKILDQFDAPCLEDPQIKVSVDALDLTAKAQGVIATDHRERITELESALFGTLRDPKR